MYSVEIREWIKIGGQGKMRENEVLPLAQRTVQMGEVGEQSVLGKNETT